MDLGPGTAVSGMRIEINTGHSRTVFNTVEVVYMALRVNGVLGPVFHQGRGVPMALSILGPQSHLLGSPGQLKQGIQKKYISLVLSKNTVH